MFTEDIRRKNMTRAEESSESCHSGALSYRNINDIYCFLNEMGNLHQSWRKRVDEESKNILTRGSTLINKIIERMRNQIKNKAPNTTEIPYISKTHTEVTYSLTFSQYDYSLLGLQLSKKKITFKPTEESVLQLKGGTNTFTERVTEDLKGRFKLYSNTEKYPVVILERLPYKLLEQHNYYHFEQNKQMYSLNDVPEIANKTESRISKFDMGQSNETVMKSCKRKRDNPKYPYVKLVKLSNKILKQYGYVSEKDQCNKRTVQDKIGKNKYGTLCDKLGGFRRGSIVTSNNVNEEVVYIKPSIESIENKYCNSEKRKKHNTQKSYNNNNSFNFNNKTYHRKSDIGCDENKMPVTSVSEANSSRKIQAKKRSLKRNNDSYAPPWKQTKLMLPNDQNCADSNIRNDDKQNLQFKIKPSCVVTPRIKQGFLGFPPIERTETSVQIVHSRQHMNMTDYKKKNTRGSIIRSCSLPNTDRYQCTDKVPKKNSKSGHRKIKKLDDFPSVEEYVCDITLHSMLDAENICNEIPAWAHESSRQKAVETQSLIPVEFMCKFLSCSNTTPNIHDVF